MSFGANVNLAGEIYPKSIGYVWDALGMSYVPLQQIVGGPGGLTVIADGGDAAQGATTDAPWVSGNGTVISLLKKIAAAGGSAVSITDGADATQGAVADAAYSGTGSGTVVAILKYLGAKIEAVRALLAGTLTIGGSVTANAGTNTSTANLDVALSTRTKPADQQHAIVDASALPAGASTEATLALIKAKTDNFDVALSTRTKPADTQVTDPLDRAARLLGHVAVDSSVLPTGAATQATLAALLTELLLKARVTDSQPVSGTVALDAPTLAALEFTTINASALPANAAQETGGNLDTLIARTVPGQALMNASLPVTLASDSSTFDSRVDRRAQEDALLRGLDLGSFALATRSRAERVSLTDRRGRTTRGTVR